MASYETVIGLEIHAQLLTQSKMFCGCSAEYAHDLPNTHTCPVCMGMPGSLPVINKKAIDFTIMTALALNCRVLELVKFDRKNYPYPDLMKGYQISQYDAPVGRDGWIELDSNGKKKRVRINRVHLEEDVAKLLHHESSWGESYSLVDVNRAGVPLMEVVGEPDLSSPEEARQYLVKLRTILQYLGVSTGNMEEGSFRCDANISIRPQGASETLAKSEVKNMNSFKAVYQALEYEAARHRQVATQGGRLVQETRGWIEEKVITVSMRSKECAHDYRYFPEPDLPPLRLSSEWVEGIRSTLPELPDIKRERFMADYGLPLYDASILTNTKDMADFFEVCLKSSSSTKKRAKIVSNWLLGDVSHLLHDSNTGISESKVSPDRLVELLDMIDQGVLSGSTAKQVLDEMFVTGNGAGSIVKKKGLTQINDTSELGNVVKQVIDANMSAVEDYKNGKQQSFTFLVGQVMRATKGRANPKIVNEMLEKGLGRG